MPCGVTEGEASEASPRPKAARRATQTALSCSINAVEMTVKQLLGGGITENFSWQPVNAVGEKADFVSGVIGNTLAFGNKPS